MCSANMYARRDGKEKRNKSISSNLYLKLIKVFVLMTYEKLVAAGDPQNETENVRIRMFSNAVTFTKISLELVVIDLNHIVIGKFVEFI